MFHHHETTSSKVQNCFQVLSVHVSNTPTKMVKSELSGSGESGIEYPILSYAEAKDLNITELRNEMRKRGLLKTGNESKKTLLGRIKYYNSRSCKFPPSIRKIESITGRKRKLREREDERSGPMEHSKPLAKRRKFKPQRLNNHNGYDVDNMTTIIHHAATNHNYNSNNSNHSISRRTHNASATSLHASNHYPAHMTIQQAASLSVGDVIDCRDGGGRFYEAEIRMKQGSNLKIHYVGWQETWDEWIDYQTSINRLAAVKSISERPAHRMTDLKVGDFIDVRLSRTNGEWKMAEIERLHKESGQVQIKCLWNTNNQQMEVIYWVHLDDEQETAPFGTKSFDLEQNGDGAITTNDSSVKQEVEGVTAGSGSEKIETLSLDELSELKNEMKRNMERVEAAEREMLDKMFKCIVCMDKWKNVAVDGCDHMTMCEECEEKSETKKCPICQASYSHVRPLILY